MKCYEYQAKEVFKKYGIPIPKGAVIDDLKKMDDVIEAIGLPLVIKSQILTGGRGKAGGIKFADSSEKAMAEAKKLLGSEIKGLKVNKLLIEEKLEIANEYYLGIVTDRDFSAPVVIVSSMGGMNIEDVSKRFPDKIMKKNIDYAYGLQNFQARALAYSTGIKKEDVDKVVRILMALYHLYKECDAELTEINPLVITSNGQIIAADGRLNIDGNALYRHPDLKQYQERTLEVIIDEEARLKWVNLGGDIGIISTGAGMGMAVLDQVIAAGGKPANFLDGGMGLLDKGFKVGLDLIMKCGARAILFSAYTGGRSDTMASKFVEAIESSPALQVPVVVRLQGLNQEEAIRIISNCNYKNMHIVYDIDEAARMVVKLAGRGK
ncbi:MAG: acetate--CoA ligase family protein [Proteobacteria bacterium]|nr:acetate--CoA ligase family protein [Pseudomonadota bacterium]